MYNMEKVVRLFKKFTSFKFKSIFEKTDTNSQPELIRLVLAGIMAVWGEYEAADRAAREAEHAAKEES